MVHRSCCVLGCKSSEPMQISHFGWPEPKLYKSIHLKKLADKRMAAWNNVVPLKPGTEGLKEKKICSKHFTTGYPAKLTSVSEIDWIPTIIPVFYEIESDSGANKTMESFVVEMLQEDEPQPEPQPEEQEDDMEFEEDKILLDPESESGEIVNQTVGPENGAIQMLIKVAKRDFVGQQVRLEGLPQWLIRAHSIEAFRAYLWELAEPHIRRPVNVETNQEGQVVNVSWSSFERPTIEEADKFITIINKKNRRPHILQMYPWNYLNSPAIERWKTSTSTAICIYMYSMAVSSRPIFELVREKLLKPKAPKAKPKVKPVVPPAADGYSFRDEVRAIRETFLQMRDLMHILDNRIAMLETKCDQAFEPEPLIPVRLDPRAAAAGKLAGGDPLLYAEIKEEDDEYECD
ncbi:uncharacterized protein LOC109430470 isoform X1 [Aedes albopictus]|uniref:THAP-type domain-containing protein n=1 Tax=Aedes albopictus TaxID=7160 RepID=A0ABM1ZR13_AEDAL